CAADIEDVMRDRPLLTPLDVW
nr:immunoglobulin heavy chain junction region [Macaca mulatta]MOW99598.1 immunoglobulin heavy chain junction region [Macaca mulatta]MOX00122.1 immunoglobulin heavy chain junction region [Macaca mulatta]MOX01837.1 immunoglobulin heavy chain junction region [Macaca mulatta]MOX01929.1 immunoglobulin heavy chain junction region [Macaca mulatta]